MYSYIFICIATTIIFFLPRVKAVEHPESLSEVLHMGRIVYGLANLNWDALKPANDTNVAIVTILPDSDSGLSVHMLADPNNPLYGIAELKPEDMRSITKYGGMIHVNSVLFGKFEQDEWQERWESPYVCFGYGVPAECIPASQRQKDIQRKMWPFFNQNRELIGAQTGLAVIKPKEKGDDKYPLFLHIPKNAIQELEIAYDKYVTKKDIELPSNNFFYKLEQYKELLSKNKLDAAVDILLNGDQKEILTATFMYLLYQKEADDDARLKRLRGLAFLAKKRRLGKKQDSLGKKEPEIVEKKEPEIIESKELEAPIHPGLSLLSEKLKDRKYAPRESIGWGLIFCKMHDIHCSHDRQLVNELLVLFDLQHKNAGLQMSEQLSKNFRHISICPYLPNIPKPKEAQQKNNAIEQQK